MGRSETFEHTADLGLRIFAIDLPDLFRTAGEGLFDIIVANRAEVRVVATDQVSLSAETTQDLLFDWLNELLYHFDANRLLFGHFKVHLEGTRLKVAAGGEPLDPARHLLSHEVKAITYHALRVEHATDGWLAEVIVDI